MLSWRWFRVVAVVGLALGLVVNYQGCGDTSLLINPGNGSGYEGVDGGTPDRGGAPDGAAPTSGTIYLTAYFVVYGDCGGRAGHVSVIQRVDGQYRLLRQNCIDLNSPLLLNGEQVQVDPNKPGTLIFNGQVYVKESYD